MPNVLFLSADIFSLFTALCLLCPICPRLFGCWVNVLDLLFFLLLFLVALLFFHLFLLSLIFVTLLYFWGLLFLRMIFFVYVLPVFPVFQFPFQDFVHFLFQCCGWLAFPELELLD